MKSGEGGIRTPGGCYTMPVFKTGATPTQLDSPQHVVITPDSWVHQLSESGAFDDPEFQLLAQSWQHLFDAVKSGIAAMVHA